MVEHVARPARHVATESSQHCLHAAAVEGADHRVLRDLNSSSCTTTRIGLSLAPSILSCSDSQAARRGVRSGDTQVGSHTLLDCVVRTGEAFWARDLLFVIERHGFVEDTYFDVSYDPVRVEFCSVGGVFCIVTETTERVVGARRLALLRDLAAQNATARTERDACVLAMETLAMKPDVAFALAYLDDELQATTPDGVPSRTSGGTSGASSLAPSPGSQPVQVPSSRLT